MSRATTATWLLVAAVTLWPAAAGAQRPDSLSFAELDQAYELERLVNLVADGRYPGGDAWLKWSPHLLRADRDLVYVPFVLTIDEAPGAFRRVALYMRAAPHGERSSAGRRRARRRGVTGLPTGAIPVFVPEREFVPPGTPVAGEAALALRLAHPEGADQPRYPFEDIQFIDLEREAGGVEPYRLQRALAVPPGDYDIYVAIREYPVSDEATPKAAVLKQRLVVPAFPSSTLAMSSLILADEIAPLDGPLSAEEQVARPFAFGTAEVTPATNPMLGTDEALSVMFFLYNLRVDQGKPDVTVTYRFYRQVLAGIEYFSETAPQRFDAESLPPSFALDPSRGYLPVAQAVPLASFSEGSYRLEVGVTDNLASSRVVESLSFLVQEGSAGSR